MAYGMSSGPERIRLHQALHGYSEGHRLLASSLPVSGRDAKTMLMMSDASGPGASIDEPGYLTGYPLPDSGYYVIARTWGAPEMSRPGCVWTHSILVEFSDIPALATARTLLELFKRPSGSPEGYDITLNQTKHAQPNRISDEDALRRLLWGLYAHPRQPVIASRPTGEERERSALAIWDQQWPRLRRSFRFCTLSFADRSSTGAAFDLQFLPALDRAYRPQFGSALDADRIVAGQADWLQEALTDLRAGPAGSLRRFLKEAGGDVSGRDAFAPLAGLHFLSHEFASTPQAVEQAIELVEETIPPSQGRAMRALIARAAGSTPESLGRNAIDFVVRHWELLEQEDAEPRAEALGTAFWTQDPTATAALLSDTSGRRVIAERAIAKLTPDELVEGIAKDPALLPKVLDMRPDVATAPTFWSLQDASNPRTLQTVAQRPEAIRAVLSAMMAATTVPVRIVCRVFGHEQVLRAVIELLDGAHGQGVAESAKLWLFEASSDANVVAKVLADQFVRRQSTLEAEAEVVAPDLVPNSFGDDPWLAAWRGIAKDPDRSPSLYLSCFLLARALGYRSRNQADLIKIAFGSVYAGAQRSEITEPAWRLLDNRLPRSYFWQHWDRCQRLRSGVVDAFVDRRLSPDTFLNLTDNQTLFNQLVDLASESHSGRKYLRYVSRSITDGSRYDRLKLIEEKSDW